VQSPYEGASQSQVLRSSLEAAIAAQMGTPTRQDIACAHQFGSKPLMNEQELQKRLELLKTEHRDLDAAILALVEAGATDQLQIARLKKRKLRLKDQIASIEDTLLPDIIA
jgi:hypothetical protein